MPSEPTPAQLAQAASDPQTGRDQLRAIAYHYPTLRPLVAANPAVDAEFRSWIMSLDAAPNLAVAAQPARQAGQAAAASSGDDVLRKFLWAAIIVTSIFVAVVFWVIWGMPGSAGPGGPEASNEEATVSAQSEMSRDEVKTTDTSQSDGSEEVRYPAPTDALKMEAFMTPSGNIACTSDSIHVECSIATQNWDDGGFKECYGPDIMSLSDTQAGLTCRGDNANTEGNFPALPYQSSAIMGDFACLSAREGVSCWNVKTGKSFAMARGGWQSGDTGLIPVGDFTW